MTTRPFTAACVQMTSGSDVAANIEAASDLIRHAAGEGADFIATPENTNLLLLDNDERFRKVHLQADDPALAAFTALAQDLHKWVLIGSLAIRVSADKVANRSFLIAPDGTIAAQYDKIHLFDVDLPDGESYRESAVYEPGTAVAIAGLPWGHIGLSICFDLRFPYIYRELAQRGAEVLTVPSAFTRQTGEAHWHVLLRARAIETGSFVIAPAQTGDHDCGRKTYGHSLIVDPWGTVLADGGTDVGVVLAEIDPAKVADARARIPAITADIPPH
jgi:predicted amidohydrolase